ncbi:MAG: mannose-6-phosphate isomerase [Candidatus Cloacimonadota bacterium]|nr:MAG: mannose-6-phosphate isomerase [Candidatus Cloacimonadota bacterium]PIE78003.1 MAG: mannose-6-phosphate isomerase [Candidatus Delongbacteria bacterium]
MKKYPIIFKPYLVEKVWGGEKLKEFGKKVDKNIGESWEISCRKEWNSTILNGEYKGKNISYLMENYQMEFFGYSFDKFPLLIKFLDINDKLSVQVHPDDKYAQEKENDFGKFETWYIMDASEDATIIAGLSDKFKNIKDLKNKLKKGDDSPLKKVKVKKGDFLTIEPGLVHATIEGFILISEIQQNSDTTYRLYDFNRVDSEGKKRELHLTKAGEVINPSLSSTILSTEDIEIENGILELSSSEFFRVSKIKLNNTLELFDDKFSIMMIISGDLELKDSLNSFRFKKGDTFMLPANYSYSISSDNCEIIYVTL